MPLVLVQGCGSTSGEADDAAAPDADRPDGSVVVMRDATGSSSGGDASDSSPGADARSGSGSSGGDSGTSSSSGGGDAAPAGDASLDALAVDAAPGATDAAESAAGTVYSGYYIPAGLDHVLLFKADTVRNLCFIVSLAAPYSMTGGLMLPATWGLEQAGAYNDAAACVASYSGGAQHVATTSQSGSISWPGPGAPKMVDINVTLTFPTGAAWVPPQESLVAHIAVQ
jgi:hypothetical protein